MSAEQILASLELLDESDKKGGYRGISLAIFRRETVDDCRSLLSINDNGLRMFVIEGLGSWLSKNSKDEVSV